MDRSRSFFALLPIWLAVGCNAAPDTMPDLSKWIGDWVLGGETSAATNAPSLRIESDGSIGGSTGVNRFRGKLDVAALAAGRWESTPLVTTLMAGTEAAMELEARFTRALGEATAIELRGDALTLLRDGAELLRFVRAQ